MGAYDFSVLQVGSDPSKAFHEARKQAGYDDGHAGYSGTIYEKHDFTIITSQTHDPESAGKLADKLFAAEDPRIDDKWGPAGAIPVALDYRDVVVEELSGADRTDEAALRATVEAKLRERKQLHRGETVQSVNLYSYSSPDAAPASRYATYAYSASRLPSKKFTGGTAHVRIKKAGGPTDREVLATLVFDHEPSREDIDKAVQAAAKLKPNERVLNHEAVREPMDFTDGWVRTTKVVAKATEGKPVTRYLVKSPRGTTPFERGFPSQADARAAAVKAAESQPSNSYDAEAEWDVTSETRRENGDPLVRVRRVVTKATAKVKIAVRLTPPEVANRQPDAWLFFGYASS
jgi:hypothetical protein